MEWNFKFAPRDTNLVDISRIDFVFDIEANNLLEKVTKLWVLVLQNYKTKEFYVFTDEKTWGCPKHGSFEDGVRFLSKCRYKICHNIASYDWFVLNKFYPDIWNKKTVPWESTHDTYIQSKAQWYERPKAKGVKGTHGLAYYGQILGYPKPPIEDWSYWDAEKLNRCIVDVEINTRTLEYLGREKSSLLAMGVDTTSQTLRAKITQYWCTIQGINGMKADAAMMREHLVTLDKRISELTDEIEPQLPQKLCVHNKRCTWEDISVKWDDFYRKVPPTRFELRRSKGEIVEVPIKPTYMPTLKVFLKSGMYDKHTADWFGIPRDPLESNRMVGGAYTKIYYEDTHLTQHDQVKKFLLSLGWIPTEYNIKKDVYGNILKDENGALVKGSPKLTEDSFDSLPEGIGQSIAEYNTLMHRKRTLFNEDDEDKGWLNQIRTDGRLAAGANVFNTATSRMTQFGIVNCPSPAAKFGKQMREVWICEPENYLVSTDMDSAQLVILSGYMEDETFIHAVKDGTEFEEYEDEPEKYCEKTKDGKYKVYVGTDAHTVNSIYFTLNTQSDVELARESQDIELVHKVTNGRKKAKNGIYCLLFGGGDLKFAKTVGLKTAAEGKKIKDAYFTKLPKLKAVKDRLERQYDEKKFGKGGYIQVGGGVWLYAKSKHVVLNYLLMGTEAQIQNEAICLKCQRYEDEKILTKQVLTIHDEQTDECLPHQLEDTKKIMSWMYGEASKRLGLKVPVTGTAMAGSSYLAVH